MPHLTLQMSVGGPLVDVLIGVSHPRAQALQKAGQTVPNPARVRALVDTGASCTCVDPSILAALGLAPTGITPIHTPSTGTQTHAANQYDVSLVLIHPALTLTLGAVPVVESQLKIQGIQGLIGRDVLSNCLLVYDGPNRIFTLAF